MNKIENKNITTFMVSDFIRLNIIDKISRKQTSYYAQDLNMTMHQFNLIISLREQDRRLE